MTHGSPCLRWWWWGGDAGICTRAWSDVVLTEFHWVGHNYLKQHFEKKSHLFSPRKKDAIMWVLAVCLPFPFHGLKLVKPVLIIPVEIFIELLYNDVFIQALIFKIMTFIRFFNSFLNTDSTSFALHWSQCNWEGQISWTQPLTCLTSAPSYHAAQEWRWHMTWE